MLRGRRGGLGYRGGEDDRGGSLLGWNGERDARVGREMGGGWGSGSGDWRR